MTRATAGIILFLLFFALPLYMVHARTMDTAPSSPNSSIENIGQMIRDKTPGFIARPILAIANGVEEFRVRTGIQTKNNKETVQAEIKELNADKTSIKAKSGASDVVKPVKYIKLYFFMVVSFIFNKVLVFYGILLVVFFFILRFFWRLIF